MQRRPLTLVASTPAAATQDRSTAPPTPTADAADPTLLSRGGNLGGLAPASFVAWCWPAWLTAPTRRCHRPRSPRRSAVSAGAVSNALTVLAGQGAVLQTQVKPRRYTLAQQTQQAGVTG